MRRCNAQSRASAKFARGVLSLAAGEHEQARTALEDATRLFHRSGAPFEATQARLELARALRGLGRTADAQREARAAGVSFRRLGAEREAERAEELVRALEITGTRVPDPSPLTRREQEVVRLVAEGKTDRAIASALTLSEHTVHRHVANILAKLDSTSRSAAVAEALRRRLI